MGSLGVTNGYSSLPDKDSQDVYLVQATPEESTAQTIANSSEWKGALPTVDAYIRREEYLANQALTKNGGLTIWMLVYQPEGHERKVLCGCETIKKKALVGKNGNVEEVIVHGVGSVFTPPAHRGKAYARRMMTGLAQRLKSWQVDNGKRALFSVLFSDIGKQFYAKMGWHPFPSAHVAISIRPQVASGLPVARLLKSSDLPELCEIDEKLTRQRLSATKDSARSSVALIPDTATISWHHAREEFVAKELWNRKPLIKGAIFGDAGSRVWCYWTRVWKDPEDSDDKNVLHILRLAVEDPSFSDFAPASSEYVSGRTDSNVVKSIAALLAAAQIEAAGWEIDEIQLWNPTSTTLAAAQMVDSQAAVEYRESDSIPSLLWYGQGSERDVEWICNEKFG